MRCPMRELSAVPARSETQWDFGYEPNGRRDGVLCHTSNVSERTDALLAAMTLAEKADLVMGEDMWVTRPVPRLEVPAMVVTDGPNGARGGGLMGTGTPTACIPAGSVLGATWDPSLVERLGELLGDETRAKGAHVLLAPTINLHRNPLGGRNFECYSEDPFLTGAIAVGFIKGVQSRKVAVTAKHFVGNDSEFERNTIDTQADERTLREVYLAPFEASVKQGGAWGIMSSYNRLNGTYASEHSWLLNTVLRQQWGFDGFVISDWFAVRSTAASVRAGLSLEMPGRGSYYGAERIGAAIEAGELDEAHLDAVAADVLTVMERTGVLDGTGGGAEQTLDRPEDRALVREAAAAGTVLIANNGLLPLDPASVGSIAVIGPNARQAKVMGGGSANVRAYRRVSPLDALTDRFGGTVPLRYAQGCDIDRSTPPLTQPLLEAPLSLEFFDGLGFEGEVIATSTAATGRLSFFGSPAEGVNPKSYSMRASGTLRPTVTGTHSLRLVQAGRAKVLLDGEVCLDATEGTYESGDEFFGFGSEEISVDVELSAGVAVTLEIEFVPTGAVLLSGLRLGLTSQVERDLLTEAEGLAAESDVALVVVGTNDDWETEGRDRELFVLPGDQVELIERVSAVNPKTIVVVNTGGPHAMDWLNAPAATLSVGFAGQEMGDALVDVLFGDADPGGRMPTTVPARYEHSPAYLSYPGENSVVRYAEGLFVGYRWFDARHIDPAVPFGHGLSYATFQWGDAQAPVESTTAVDTPIEVVVPVTNTANRAGSEVVQLFVEPPKAMVQRPVRELKGFAKLSLDPGQSGMARIVLDARSFAYFDPGDQLYEQLAAAGPVPVGSGTRHTEPGWYVEPGTYRLVLGRSSVDHVQVIELELTGQEHRFDA